MVTAKLMLMPGEFRNPKYIVAIIFFFAILYSIAMVLLIFRIEQCKRLKKKVIKLERRIKKLK